jgi:hypothetical protein
MSGARPEPAELGPLRTTLAESGGRAIGLWSVRADRLEQVGFIPARTLDRGVAEEFAEATRSVPLDRPDLGIVRAVTSGAVSVSRADRLPPDAGSGRWLRAFDAVRSVAVPVRDGEARVVGVVSIALGAEGPDDEAIASRLEAIGRSLLGREAR